jgi:hypothetical protein
MSRESNPQLSHAPEQEGNVEQELNAASVPAGSTPKTEATPTAFHFRKGFMNNSKFEVLMGMGEDPREYGEMMEALLEDLQPRRGLESQLVEQMGETFWRMRRSQRIRDGVALKNIRAKVPGEDMAATVRSSQAFNAMEPFERLGKALARRGQGPTAAEIEEFVSSRESEPSPAMQEFITLLNSLDQPMEEKDRRAARRKARKQLAALQEPYAILATQCMVRSERVQGAVNLAALMAPEDNKSMYLQRLEDANFRRLWRLINALGKVRQGALEKKRC